MTCNWSQNVDHTKTLLLESPNPALVPYLSESHVLTALSPDSLKSAVIIRFPMSNDLTFPVTSRSQNANHFKSEDNGKWYCKTVWKPVGAGKVDEVVTLKVKCIK